MNVKNLELSLCTFLDFEEKIRRTSYSFGIHDSHKDLSSLIPVIKSLQDHMFFLESQSSNHVGSMSWEPCLLRPNYNESTTCDQELGCVYDHYYIMILSDQSSSHIPNITLLKPHKKTQPQDHISFRASYLHAYDGEFEYAIEEINSDYVKPMYDMSYLLMIIVSGQDKLMNTRMTFMIDVMSLPLNISMNSIEILNCMTLLLIHYFN
jgi:hypothetical protein